MCYSATADLAAGSVLGAVGVVALARVRRPREVPMAALPLVLGVHQLLEAVIWHADGRSVTAGARWALDAWVVIAFPLLPVLLPLAVLSAVWPVAGRIRPLLLTGCALGGVVVAAVLGHAVAAGPVTARVDGHTLRYGVGVPAPGWVVAGYLVATIGSLLVCGDRALRRLGAVCAVGAVVCAVLWTRWFVSTWCALAAVSSVLVLDWLRRRHAAPDRGAVPPR